MVKNCILFWPRNIEFNVKNEVLDISAQEEPSKKGENTEKNAFFSLHSLCIFLILPKLKIKYTRVLGTQIFDFFRQYLPFGEKIAFFYAGYWLKIYVNRKVLLHLQNERK